MGKSWRFLEHEPSLEPPEQSMALRQAAYTGEPCSATLVRRRRTGELLKIATHVRGLVVGEEAYSGEELWFLVTVYEDISDASDEEADAAASRLEDAATEFLQRVAEELTIKVEWAGSETAEPCDHSPHSPTIFNLLSPPSWRMSPK